MLTSSTNLVLFHCVKSVYIRSYSGPHFPSLRIRSECGKMRTRITPNTDTFHAVNVLCLKNQMLILLVAKLGIFCMQIELFRCQSNPDS